MFNANVTAGVNGKATVHVHVNATVHAGVHATVNSTNAESPANVRTTYTRDFL